MSIILGNISGYSVWATTSSQWSDVSKDWKLKAMILNLKMGWDLESAEWSVNFFYSNLMFRFHIVSYTFQSACLAPLEAHEQFAAWMLHPGEILAVYVVVLQKLAWLFGELPKRVMAYSFLAELPLRVKELLQANSSIDTFCHWTSCWAMPKQL